jgi:hypothetical protein
MSIAPFECRFVHTFIEQISERLAALALWVVSLMR